MSEEHPSRAITLEAPAKLNISLAVTGRRIHGPHELAGLMVLLELADTMLLGSEPAGFHVHGEERRGVPTNADENLAWRGLVAAMGDDAERCRLDLHKRIPAQAGLGGGSSDAAAAWRLGRRTSGIDSPATSDELHDLASIGADVPFFAATAAAAWVTGIGEVVEPMALPAAMPREVVLAHPPFGLSTAAVFTELRPDEWSSPPQANDLETVLDAGNDLLAPARRLRPELDDLMRLFLSAGAQPRMTGSGPRLYALLDEPQHADAIAARLRRAGVAASRTRLRAEPASIGLEEVSE